MKRDLTPSGDADHVLKTLLLSSIVKSREPQRGTMYSRTQNDNGTYNTRCLYCFMTVASAVETAHELDQFEVHHICPEKALAQMLANEKPAEAHPHRN